MRTHALPPRRRYIDSTFCSGFHRLKTQMGADNVLLLGKAVIFIVWGLGIAWALVMLHSFYTQTMEIWKLYARANRAGWIELSGAHLHTLPAAAASAAARKPRSSTRMSPAMLAHVPRACIVGAPRDTVCACAERPTRERAKGDKKMLKLCRELLHQFDANHNGTLEASELMQLMTALHDKKVEKNKFQTEPWTRAQIDKLWRKHFDVDGDGQADKGDVHAKLGKLLTETEAAHLALSACPRAHTRHGLTSARVCTHASAHGGVRLTV